MDIDVTYHRWSRRGGGQVVSVLAFLCKIVVEKNKNRQKEAGLVLFLKNWQDWLLGNGCGSVDAVVASNARDPRFKSSPQQIE